MQLQTIFDSHFRAAETLLKVYRLLRSDAPPSQIAAALPGVRTAVGCDANEEVVFLLNDLFAGLVRERAALRARDFHHDNMALLLRQATVSACTALDVFFPALLEAHLPVVIQIKQRNFLPRDGEIKTLFDAFRLRLDELPALLEEEDSTARWAVLARRIIEYTRDKTLSNVTGITAVMLLLGVDRPWAQIAQRAGLAEVALRDQVQALVKRRNDIMHRGDRPVGQPDAPPQTIDYAWTSSHVNAVQSVVLASDALAQESIRQLQAEAVAA